MIIKQTGMGKGELVAKESKIQEVNKPYFLI